MVSSLKLKEAFDELGSGPDDDVLDKCVEMCLKYDIDDEVEFVERWMAFSVSYLGGADPTLDTLNDMEIKEYAHQPKSIVKDAAIINMDVSVDETADLKIYNIDEDEADCVMNSYVPITPKVKKSLMREKINTPENPKINFSPASYSPLTPSSKPSEKSGSIVYTFGSSKLVKNTVWSSTRNQNSKIKIEILGGTYEEESTDDRIYDGNQENEDIVIEDNSQKMESENTAEDRRSSDINTYRFMTSQKGYMHDTTLERSLILGEKIYDIGMEICAKPDEYFEDFKTINENKLGDDTVESLDTVDDGLEKFREIIQNNVDQAYYQKKVQCLGRIVSKASKMDKNSAELLGADETKVRQVKLDFTKVQNAISIFPGQTVIVKGNNINGQKFVVDEISSERVLSHFPTPPAITEPLTIIVASSPFTTDDNLLFEPLTDLIGFCKNNKPDVLILTGPFLDSKSWLLKNMAQSFDEHFEKIVCSLMESIGPETEVIIQSSHKDVNSSFVYPTHPYVINENFSNLHFIPDPCIIDINSMKIGVTSTDTIGHLVENELIINTITDKVKRSINYIFHQKSFYPLMPPHDNTPVDLGLADEYAKLTTLPNMMILPSSLKCFLRDVNKCLCINPGHLYETTGGTFARFVVHPPPHEDSTLFEYVSCQVVKV